MNLDRVTTILHAFVSRGEIAAEMREQAQQEFRALLSDPRFSGVFRANIEVAMFDYRDRIDELRLDDLDQYESVTRIVGEAYGVGLGIGLGMATMAEDR